MNFLFSLQRIQIKKNIHIYFFSFFFFGGGGGGGVGRGVLQQVTFFLQKIQIQKKKIFFLGWECGC